MRAAFTVAIGLAVSSVYASSDAQASEQALDLFVEECGAQLTPESTVETLAIRVLDHGGWRRLARDEGLVLNEFYGALSAARTLMKVERGFLPRVHGSSVHSTKAGIATDPDRYADWMESAKRPANHGLATRLLASKDGVMLGVIAKNSSVYKCNIFAQDVEYVRAFVDGLPEEIFNNNYEIVRESVPWGSWDEDTPVIDTESLIWSEAERALGLPVPARHNIRIMGRTGGMRQ